MPNHDVFGYVYALTVAAGGIIVYLKAGSTPSLIAGLVFGAIVGAGAWLISTENNHLLMLVGSGVLAAFMGLRFYNSGKFMPAGLVAGLSILMVCRSLYNTVAK